MTAAPTGDERDARFGLEGGLEVDRFVGEVAGYGGVGAWDRREGRIDQVGRIVDEVFCCISG